MAAYEQGWAAAERGLSIRACPFHSQSGEAIAWRNGWRAAHDACGLIADPLARLRHHVTGAIERGEAQAIVEKKA